MVTVVPSNSPTWRRQLEEFQCFLQSDGLDALVGRQLGKLWLVLVFGGTNLNHWTESSDLYEYRAAALWVLAQFTLTGLVLAACFHHTLHFWFETLVEVLHPFGPLGLSLGDIIELLLYVGSKVIVHDVREVGHQEVVYHDTDIGREELALSDPACSFLVFWVIMIPFSVSTV